jgi:hypothetical protein
MTMHTQALRPSTMLTGPKELALMVPCLACSRMSVLKASRSSSAALCTCAHAEATCHCIPHLSPQNG